REMCANAHSFASASTFPPMTVSQGDALAGVAIDFYGRGQAQAVLRRDESPGEGRVGGVGPKGGDIDADAVSILRGGPNPTLAKRFIEFVMSDEGQAVWQFAPYTSAAGKNNPWAEGAEHGMGPREYALRRMPSRRAMYEKYKDTAFVDKVDPF